MKWVKGSHVADDRDHDAPGYPYATFTCHGF